MSPIQKTEPKAPNPTPGQARSLQTVLNVALPGPIVTVMKAAAIVAETVEAVNDLSSPKEEDQENRHHDRREDVRQKPPHVNQDRLEFFKQLGTRIYGLGIANILKPLVQRTHEVGTEIALKSNHISTAAKDQMQHIQKAAPEIVGQAYTEYIVNKLKEAFIRNIMPRYNKLQPGVADTLLYAFDLIGKHGSFNEEAMRDLARNSNAFKIIMNSLPGSGMIQVVALAAETIDFVMDIAQTHLKQKDKYNQELAEKALGVSDFGIACESALRTVAQAVTKYSMRGIRLIAIASR